MKKLFLILCALSLTLLISCNKTSTESVNNDITDNTELVNDNYQAIADTTSTTDIETSSDSLLNMELLSLIDITDDMKVYKSCQYQTIDNVTYTSSYGYLDINSIDDYSEDEREYRYRNFNNADDLLPAPITDMPNAKFCIVDDYMYYLEVASDGCIYNNEIYRSDKYGCNAETIAQNNASSFYVVGNYLIYRNTNSGTSNYTFYNIDTKESISMPFVYGISNITNGKIYFHDSDYIYYYDFETKTINKFENSFPSGIRFSESYLYSYHSDKLTVVDMLGNNINEIKLPFEKGVYDGYSYKDTFYIVNDTTIYSVDLSTGEISNQYSIEISNVNDIWSACVEYVNDTDIYISCYSNDFLDSIYCHYFKLNLEDLSFEFIGKRFFS